MIDIPKARASLKASRQSASDISLFLEGALNELEANRKRIAELEAENDTLSLLGKKISWKERQIPTEAFDEYAAFIFIVNDGYEMRKWVSKKKELPSEFLARILSEKQGVNGQWKEYLMSDLGCIIPHAGDAQMLGFVLSGDWNPKICGCVACKEAEAVIRRYITAIEGPCQKE